MADAPDGEGHPALRAWARLGPDAPPEGPVETLKNDGTAVYRWRPRGAAAAVVAKRCRGGTARIERIIYEEVLPHVPVASARYHGAVEDTGSGFTWLFFDDVGDRRYHSHDAAHRRAAARWLGTLHVAASRVEAARRLPSRAPSHYLELLRAARAALSDARAAEGTEALLLERLDAAAGALESEWPGIEDACSLLPDTVVHGDFIDNNVHVSGDAGDPSLVAIDWEKAGWGRPAEDVSGVDLAVYHESVREAWPHLASSDLRRAAGAGRMLRCVVYLDWIASRVTAKRISEVRDDARRCRAWLSRQARSARWRP